eukprot:TRINITY_DN74672_c0_g1_i1.p1 TRINITY_DN74672_c0_g1~~TRINITY_DN74672_c0_g1_i1.p1  ORF type:complete len:191 (-),score=49.37 TRINITY_DN74672_c0_g1_i1:20-592(-)
MVLNRHKLRGALSRAAKIQSWESPEELFRLTLASPSQKDGKGLRYSDFIVQFRSMEDELKKLRDEAKEERLRSRADFVPVAVDCPKRHCAAAFITWDDGFCCSICKKDIEKGEECLGCRLCDHDVCQRCNRRLLKGQTVRLLSWESTGEPEERRSKSSKVRKMQVQQSMAKEVDATFEKLMKEAEEAASE